MGDRRMRYYFGYYPNTPLELIELPLTQQETDKILAQIYNCPVELVPDVVRVLSHSVK